MAYLHYEHKINNDFVSFFEGEFNISIESDYFLTYLQNHNIGDIQISILKEKLKNNESISILMNLGVNKQYKKTGNGKKILSLFLSHAKGCVLLICDTTQSNTFSLQQWYEKHGFEIIDYNNGNPIMLKTK